MPFVDFADTVASLDGNDIIEEVLRLLMSGDREEMNKLQGAVAPGATTLSFQFDLGQIRVGSLVNIDLETYRVWSVDDTNKTAVVEPAMAGTQTDAHSDGALVYVNPRMSRAGIFKAINDEIVSLSAEGLWSMQYYEFPWAASQSEYDFPVSDLMDIYKVTMLLPGPERRWAKLDLPTVSLSSDIGTFPSGQSIYVPDGLSGQPIRVLYKKMFSKLIAPEDDIAFTAGVPTEMQDIIAMGTLARLGATREIKRNFTEAQGDTRRATEVPPTAVLNSFKYASQTKQKRVDDERARLLMKWPLL